MYIELNCPSSIKKQLVELFGESLKATFPTEPDIVPLIDASTKHYVKEADYQCNNVMALWAKIKGNPTDYKNPHSIGKSIVKNLPPSEMVESYSVATNGFVNIVLSKKWMAKSLQRMLTDGIDSWAPRLPDQVKRVMVDFSSPNIAKEMHVGHLRSTIIGDTLARMLEICQAESLIRRNHIGDCGTQFGMLIVYLFEKFPNPEDVNESTIGDLQAFYKASKSKYDSDPDFAANARKSVVKLQSGDTQYVKYRTAWKQICDISRNEFNKVYERLGIRLEEMPESSFNSLIPKTLKKLEKLGLIEESEGARVIFVKGVDRPIIAVKSDSGYNYSSTDLASLRRAGWLPKDENEYPKCTHIDFGLVHGNDGKRFRSRSSETVRLVDLLDEAKKRCKVSLRKRDNAKDWTEEEIEKTSEAIGYGAVKYADLKINRTTNYTSNFDKMLNDKGNTAVYLLYAHARICSIIKKSGKDIEELKRNGNLVLDHKDERALALHLLKFTEEFVESCSKMLPNELCEYLHEMVEIFTEKFYPNCQVIGSPEETSRLLLCEATLVVMRKCFYLLGIEPVYNL